MIMAQNLETVELNSKLSRFEIGDYVVTLGPQQGRQHGYIIVNYGDAVKCDGSGDLIHNTVLVPYVADLPGTQSGQSRPFYCTRIAEDFNVPNSFFEFNWWYFIKVPDQWFIHFSRIYTDPITE